MIKITFEINGRPVTSGNIADALEAAMLGAVENDIRAKLAGIRDPETGEFPVIAVKGSSLKNLSFEVSGSPKLVSLVKDVLGRSDEEEANNTTSAASTTDGDAHHGMPCVFLSYASEDKEIARRMASAFQQQGIETFFDEWEIGPGDSLRQKIDSGLGRCTHFVVLLTSESIQKPWVNAEIDAGFVKKVSGACKFIALRHGLSAEALPPLLAGLHSPSLNDFERDITALVHAIHGVTRKPPLGEVPPIVKQSSRGALGLSAAAEVIARLMIERSEHGESFDPQIEADELRKETGLADDDLVDAVDELVGRGFVRKHVYMGSGSLGFGSVMSDAALFVAMDKHFKEWNPEQDALRIAADLVNGVAEGIVSTMAEKYGWPPRRMNPAVNYLVERGLVEASRAVGTHPWCCHWISKNHGTRRFVRDRS